VPLTNQYSIRKKEVLPLHLRTSHVNAGIAVPWKVILMHFQIIRQVNFMQYLAQKIVSYGPENIQGSESLVT
jgi:hypothetical protein